MLQELAITDFAIIQSVRLRFTSGLVIFTGETGAGKSIVLDAIGAILGERVGADVVRAGAPRAIVEGIFTLPWLGPTPNPSPSADGEGSADLPLSAGGQTFLSVPGRRDAEKRGRDGEGNGRDKSRPYNAVEDASPETRRSPAESVSPSPSADGEGAGGWGDPDPRQRLRALLQEYGLEGDDDSLIVIREIGANGRGVARVNGRAVPVSVLARLGALLVDVHGQGAHLSLLHPEQHVNFLDRYAETLPQREALAGAVRQLQAERREVAALRRDERELERRAELLRYQVDEITAAELHPGEIAELEQERTVLANAERLGELALTAHAALAGADDGETPGALDLLNGAHRTLSELARIDNSLSETLAAFDECRYQLEDIAATVRDYRDRAEADPARLAAVEERLDRISRLRRKYGATIEEILAYSEEAATELAQIDHRDERIAELERSIARRSTAIGHQAYALSQKRQAAAQAMSTAMEAALDRLNMRQARFFVQIEQKPDPEGVPFGDGPTPNPSPSSRMERGVQAPRADRVDLADHSPNDLPLSTAVGRGPGGGATRVAITPTGADRVEFLIAPNPGEPPRPLARIASGGETARLMLALKTILAGADATPTLIFDEIDAGISGLTGQIVGEMLWQLARGHQVICVTHLPQMAAFGDQHWHVAKRIVDERTSTIVTDLDPAARTLELAQMLGGIATESAARNAAELLDRAAAWKGSHTTSPTPPNGHATSPPASAAASLVNGTGKTEGKKRGRRESQ